MGRRRRKNRTHLKGPAPSEAEVCLFRRDCRVADGGTGEGSKVIRDQGELQLPKIRSKLTDKSGDVTTSITQLVKDIRQLMEPHTATRLRVR